MKLANHLYCIFAASLLILLTSCSSSTKSGEGSVADTRPREAVYYMPYLTEGLLGKTGKSPGIAVYDQWFRNAKTNMNDESQVKVIVDGQNFVSGGTPCLLSNGKKCRPLLDRFPANYVLSANNKLKSAPGKALIQVGKKAVIPFSKKVAVETMYWVEKVGASRYWFDRWSGHSDLSYLHLVISERESYLTDDRYLSTCIGNKQQWVVVTSRTAMDRTGDYMVYDCQAREWSRVEANDLFRLVRVKNSDKWSPWSWSQLEVANTKANPKTQALLSSIYKKSAPQAKKTVVNLNESLSPEKLDQWMADAYRIVSRADVAVFKKGKIKKNLGPGSVLAEEVLMLMQDKESLMGADVPLKEFKKAICGVKTDSLYAPFILSGATLVQDEFQPCSVRGLMKKTIKVVISKNLLYAKKDFSQKFKSRFFRFGVSSYEAVNRKLLTKGF